MRPIIPYVGGKKHLARRLVDLIEATPHELYAEPFVGAGGVFLRRPRPARVEAINDLAGEVANLWRIAQRHPDALAAELRFAHHGRAQWERLAALDPAHLTDIERAARFVCLQKSAFGGKAIGRNFAMAKAGGHGRSFDRGALLARLEAVHARLARVTIEQLPFAEFIRRYDAPTALFYCDPPYFGSEAYYGPGLFDRPQFQDLRDALARIRGRFIVSINDAAEIRELFAGFDIQEARLSYGLAAAGSTAARELIITGP
ncbi:MAG TPA: DNA adenine methylase [Caulobacteraceae bacterium]|nr:DNA adenine methylase [Caulobacteraceae bacterium]